MSTHFDKSTILAKLRERRDYLTTQVGHLGEIDGLDHCIAILDEWEDEASRPILTPTETLEMAEALERRSDDFKKHLQDLQPRTSREQWMAAECLEASSRQLRNAAVLMHRHVEKYGAKKKGGFSNQTWLLIDPQVVET